MNTTLYKTKMRELINILNESVGLANRKKGETFVNPSGDLLTFNSLIFYPTDGRFDNADDMKQLVSEIEQRKQAEVEWVNKATSASLAFGVAEFVDTDGNIRLFGRYFGNINPIFTANYWPNSGLPEGLRYNKAAATKMSSGLMPQDVLTTMEGLTPADILAQVTTKFGAKHPLTKLTADIVAGRQLPIEIDVSKNPEISFTGFRDYFNEILQPIAVINGLCSGNAADAEKVFLGKNGFKKCTISFSTGKNTGLYDSLLVAKGQEIKISTKGAVGATASVKNLVDSANELAKTGNTELLNKYKDTLDLIKEVSKAGQSQAPLVLAVKFGLISGKESKIVDSMRTAPDAQLTKNLQKLYDEKAARSAVDKIIPYYTMLSAIAEKVATHVNDNTDFSHAASEILNNSALIQVYTNATEKAGKIILADYKAVYPSKAVGGVLFYAGKTYYSSGIKGNFTFKIFGNAGVTDQDIGSDGSDVAAVASKRKVAKIDTKIDDIASGASTSSIRPSRKSPVVSDKPRSKR